MREALFYALRPEASFYAPRPVCVKHSVRVYAVYGGVDVKIRSPQFTLSITTAYLLFSHHIRHIPFGMQYLVLGSILPMGHSSTVLALRQLKFFPTFRSIHF